MNTAAPETTSIDELLEDGSGQVAMVQTKAFLGQNLGYRTFLMTMPMHEFFRMSEVANDRGESGSEEITQRPLDENHARRLAQYMLRGLVAAAIHRRIERRQVVPEGFTDIQDQIGKQPYLSMQPIVANLRTCDPGGGRLQMQKVKADNSEELACLRLYLTQNDVLWVVDGQHRRMAMNYIFEFLDAVRIQQKYPKKKSLYEAPEGDLSVGPSELQLWNECFEVARGTSTVQVELHLGLNPVQERQLFHDLNNLGKKVGAGLALEFDSANPVNAFIKDVLEASGMIAIVNRDIKSWDDDDGSMARKDVVAVNAHLFLNKSNITNAQSFGIDDEKREIARRFWKEVTSIHGFGQAGAKQITVAAQSVVLKALAKLAYDFGFGRGQDEVLLDKYLAGISTLDLTHSNPMWRFYAMDTAERAAAGLVGLEEYLTTAEGNRDLGSVDANGHMRFGAKHNDIYPILSDMFRWRLSLPNRHAKE